MLGQTAAHLTHFHYVFGKDYISSWHTSSEHWVPNFTILKAQAVAVITYLLDQHTRYQCK